MIEKEGDYMEKKIITVTLNPAVDKTYTAQGILVGHVNRMKTVIKIAGGKGVNVTKILRQYDYPVAATGYLGGFSGQFIEEELLRRGAFCHFVKLEDETRSNMNIVADDGYVTELLEPGPNIGPDQQEKFWEQYEKLLESGSLVILSGSVANGIADDVYRKLTKRAKAKEIPVYLDSSGESMRKGIEAAPDLIKPNWKELEFIVGHKLADREEVVKAAKELRKKGIGRVVVSMGDKGLLCVSGEGVYYAKAPKVKAVNTVACGDSVVAAYAIAYEEKETEEQALMRACAMSAANATTMESACIPMDTAQELQKKIVVEKIG